MQFYNEQARPRIKVENYAKCLFYLLPQYDEQTVSFNFSRRYKKKALTMQKLNAMKNHICSFINKMQQVQRIESERDRTEKK